MSSSTSTTTRATSARPAHLSSESDNWPTPRDFFAALDAEFGFVLDVCASTTNHKAASFYALDHPTTPAATASPPTGPATPPGSAAPCG